MGSEAVDIAEIRESLSRPLPEIPCKYLYDDRGSAFFDRITELEEYYPTRTELAILEKYGDRIVGYVRPRELVELGSGAGHKIRILLDAMGRRGLLDRCTLLEINERFLFDSVAQLERLYPDLKVRPIVGDFNHDLRKLGPGGERLILFLAGTIGNLTPEDAATFLALLTRQMEPRDAALIGFDLVKDKARLEAAYNDSQGVTAAFNLNVLNAVNERFDADFDERDFEHVAFYDEQHAWIEMRLRARRPVRAHLRRADLRLALDAGEEIRTEVSCKYTRERVSALAAVGGMVLDVWHTDDERLFGLALLRRA